MERCRLSSLMSPPYVGDNQISKDRKSYLPRKCTKKYFLRTRLWLIIDKRRRSAKKYSLNQQGRAKEQKFEIMKHF